MKTYVTNHKSENWSEVERYLRTCNPNPNHPSKAGKHAWDVRTGERVIVFDANPVMRDAGFSPFLYHQTCPRHGGKNTREGALQSGVPKELSVACEEAK